MLHTLVVLETVARGRAWQSITEADLRRLFQVDLPVAFRSPYNLAPTHDLLMVCQEDERQARMATWGLIATPDQPKILSTFNARAETAERSPIFREAFRARRALIPLGGAYEWTGQKAQRRLLAITRVDGRPSVCAGLWAEVDGQTSCTILTTSPTGVFAEVHDRMPLLLPQDRWNAWLDPATPLTQVRILLAPSDLHQALHAYPVDAAVGNVRNDWPELHQPLPQSIS